MGLGRKLQTVLGAVALLAPLDAAALIVVRDLPASECGEPARASQSSREFVPVSEEKRVVTSCEDSTAGGVAGGEPASLHANHEGWSPLGVIANASLPGSSSSITSGGHASFEIPGRQDLSLSPVVAVLSIPASHELADRGGLGSVRVAGESGSPLDTAVPAALFFLIIIALGAKVVHQRAG